MNVKKSVLIMGAVIVSIVGLQSCYKVATVPKSTKAEVITTPVSFATDIQPLFTANCSMSGCHNSGGKAPDLTADKSYLSLINGGYIDTAEPEKSNLYLWLTGQKSTPMPPGGPNPGNINNLTLAWIQQGALNN